MKEKTEGIEKYLQDESNLKAGKITGVFIPDTAEEIRKLLETHPGPFTVYAGGTGITGAAVSPGGAVISTEKLKSIIVDPVAMTAECGAGVTLDELARELEKHGLWYPVDSTEGSATIGGNAATCAWGTRSFKYGSARDFITAASIVLASGDCAGLQRGKQKARGTKCIIETTGKKLQFQIRDISSRFDFKNSSGYYMKKNMDLLDLFIGSEGTLGVITRLALKVLKAPADITAFMVPFDSAAEAFSFAAHIRKLRPDNVIALEYFDAGAIKLMRKEFPKLKEAAAMVFAEIEDQNGTADAASQFLELGRRYGIKEESVAVSDTKNKDGYVYAAREYLPNAINDFIRRKNVRKVSTDFCVSEKKSGKLLELYGSIGSMTAIKHVIFGHIGNNNLHVNFLPEDEYEYEEAYWVYDDLVKAVCKLKGTVSAEHGLGRIKKRYLKRMYSGSEIKAMKAIKKTFDPGDRLNPGNIFE